MRISFKEFTTGDLHKFREALVNILKETNYPIITDIRNPNQEFPHGSCKGASYILGQYLLENYEFKEILYCTGYFGNSDHGWIEIDNMILDITADQFKDCADKVILTQNGKSWFHSRFKIQQKFSFELSPDHCFQNIVALLNDKMSS